MIFVFAFRRKVRPCEEGRRKKHQKEQVTAAFDAYCHPAVFSGYVSTVIIIHEISKYVNTMVWIRGKPYYKIRKI